MKRLMVAAVLAASFALGAATAGAAPIDCPGSQVAVHDGGDSWSCENKAGNTNESDKDKNANHPH